MCIVRLPVVVTVAILSIRAFALEPEQVYAKVSSSVVVVVGYNIKNPTASSLGSGVVIAPGQIVTNCHVIEGADLIYVKHGKISSVALLRFADPDRDLCQVAAVDRSQFSRAITGLVSVSELRVGQRVYAIGAPQGFDLTLSDGLISSLRTIDEGTVIQTNAPISPGSSGGGLFDTNGRLIGITSFYHKSGQNLNFAVPASWILELPTRHVDREEAANNKNEVNKKRAEAVAQRREEERLKEEGEFRETQIKEQRRAEAEQKRIEIELERIEAQEQQAEQERLRKEEEVRLAEEQKRAEEQRREDEAREVERKRQQIEADALAKWRQERDSTFEVQKRELKKWPTIDVIAEIENSHNPRGFVLDWYDNEKKILRENRERAEDRKQLDIAVELEREEERTKRVAAIERARVEQEAMRKQREAMEAGTRAKAAVRAAQQKLIEDWKVRIQVRIKNRVVVPPNMEGNPEARFEVMLLPGGEILAATIKRSSGNSAYDAAVRRAILAAQPLPVPSEPDLFQENFRELTLVFRPKD